MSKWNDIKSGVGRAASKTAKKANELAESAAQKLRLKAMNTRLSEKYEMLGRLTYKQLKTERSQAEKIAETIDAIDKLREDIKALKERIDDEKTARAERPEDIKIEDEEEKEESEETE